MTRIKAQAVEILQGIPDDKKFVVKSDLLSPPTLKTKGWKFDREEANER